MKLQLWPVYEGGRAEHVSSTDVHRAVMEWDYRNKRFPSAKDQRIISDAVAQTIAAWWHSPGEPYTTMLSTMGVVDRYTELSHFGTEAQCTMERARMALRALGAYIVDKQMNAPTGSRVCACHDCFEIAIVRAGEMCNDCEIAGCDPTDADAECQRDDAYGNCCPHCPDNCDGHVESYCGHCDDGCC